MIIYKLIKNAANIIIVNRLKYFYYLWFLLALLPNFIATNKEFYTSFYIVGFPLFIFISFFPGLYIAMFQLQFLNVNNFSDFCSSVNLSSISRFYLLYFLYGFAYIFMLIFPYFLLFFIYSMINYSKYLMIMITLCSVLNTIACALFIYTFVLSSIVVADKKVVYNIIGVIMLTFLTVLTFGGIISCLEMDFSYVGLHKNLIMNTIDNLSFQNFAFYYDSFKRNPNDSAIIIYKFLFTFFSYITLTTMVMLIDYYFFIDKFNKYHESIQKDILLFNSGEKDTQKYKTIFFGLLRKKITKD